MFEALKNRPGFECIAEHVAPFVGIECPDVVGFGLPDNAVFNSRNLWLERSKKTVPDNQYTAIVFVDVLVISSMVNAMMAGCVKDEFKPFRQFVHSLRVYEILVAQIHSVSEQRQPKPENQ